MSWQPPPSQQHQYQPVPPSMGGQTGPTRRSNSGMTQGGQGGMPHGPGGSGSGGGFYAQGGQQPRSSPRPQQPSQYSSKQYVSGGGGMNPDSFNSSHQGGHLSSSGPSPRPQQPGQQHRVFPQRSSQPSAPASMGNNPQNPSQGYGGGYSDTSSMYQQNRFSSPPNMGYNNPPSMNKPPSSGGGSFGQGGNMSSGFSMGDMNSGYGNSQGNMSGVGGGGNNAYFGGQPQQQNQPNQQFFGTNFINDPAAQLGVQFGAQALRQGTQIVNQNINKYVPMSKLKYLFNVSNSYVINKLGLLLFPFRHQSWTRLVHRSEQDNQMEGYKPPREDLNAPDMYIPSMSLVTYVLLFGIMLGATSHGKSFTPDALGATATSGIFLLGFEVLFMKLGCYFLNISTEVPWLDVISYCGYKFVAINIVMVMKIVVPSTLVVYGVFAYGMLAFGFFSLRSLKYLVIPEASSNATVVVPMRQRRIYFLFIFVGLQVLNAFFFVYST